MKNFNYKGSEIILDHKENQIASSGREFRQFGTYQKYGFWIYQFIFLDNQQIINFKFDRYNDFLYAFNND